MENYIVGSFIKTLREKQNKTQLQLAEELYVSEKTISKWETGRGLPSLSMIEPLAKSLNVSIAELFNAKQIINQNKHFNILKTCFYVCPICGNVITSSGEMGISCCGIKLIKEEAESIDLSNNIKTIDGQINVKLNSRMTKKDYVSFIAYVTNNKMSLIKLYPEQDCEVNFEKSGAGYIYYYHINDGLFYSKI